MVDSSEAAGDNTTSKASFAQIGDPLELNHFYEWNDYTDEIIDCDEEKATENADIVEGELMSLPAILSEQEYAD